MEVCVDCVASAKNAQLGGASRLELCSALSEGGLTPSVGLLRVIKSEVHIPVFVMIRPRRGMDFVYSPEEVSVMEIDIKTLKEAGADGFVFGALTVSRHVDLNVCSRLLKVADYLPCTFHRAFDVVENPLKELETIVNLGFKRILTSGQEENALLGIKLIKLLVIKCQGNISILPGSGISESNLECILKETGVKEFHASARSSVNCLEGYTESKHVAMGQSDNDSSLLITNSQLVKNMVKISKLVWSTEDRS